MEDPIDAYDVVSLSGFTDFINLFINAVSMLMYLKLVRTPLNDLFRHHF